MFGIFKKFFAFAGNQRGKWYKGIVFAILHSIFESIQFLAIAVTVRAVVENNMNSQTVWLTLGIMLASVIGTIITRHISEQSEIIGSYTMCKEKRIQIGDRMKYMPMGYFNSHSLGNITAAATTTMEEIEKIAPPALVRTIHGLIRTLIMTIALMFFDWRVGLITLAGALLFLLINAALQHKSRLLSPKRQEAQAKVVETVLEYIQGMSVVRAFKLDKNVNKAINRAIADVEEKNFKMEIGFIPYVALQQLALRLTSVVILAVSIALYISGLMELFLCLLMTICSFFVYSGLEASGLMSAFLRLVDASIDRVEEIQKNAGYGCGWGRTTARKLRNRLPECQLFLRKQEDYRQCEFYHTRHDHNCHCRPIGGRENHPLQSDGAFLGYGRGQRPARWQGCAGIHAGQSALQHQHGISECLLV